MNLGAIDLDLIVPLAVLLEERSVTRTAERLHRSQPAISGALARLRTHFNDELLVRVGNHSELSPLAERLKPLCDEAVASLERVFDSQSDFDPAGSTRTFRLVTSDYAMVVLGCEVSALVSSVAPNVRIEFETITRDFLGGLPGSLQRVDGLLMPKGTDHVAAPCLELLSDRWVCVTDADSDVDGGLTLDEMAERPWVASFEVDALAGFRVLNLRGVEPRIEVVVDGFLPVARFVRGTSRIGMVQERLLTQPELAVGIRAWDPPFELPPIAESMWWHASLDEDVEHRWFREIIQHAGRSLDDAIDL